MSQGFYWAGKVVRGAYMVLERERAQAALAECHNLAWATSFMHMQSCEG